MWTPALWLASWLPQLTGKEKLQSLTACSLQPWDVWVEIQVQQVASSCIKHLKSTYQERHYRHLFCCIMTHSWHVTVRYSPCLSFLFFFIPLRFSLTSSTVEHFTMYLTGRNVNTRSVQQLLWSCRLQHEVFFSRQSDSNRCLTENLISNYWEKTDDPSPNQSERYVYIWDWQLVHQLIKIRRDNQKLWSSFCFWGQEGTHLVISTLSVLNAVLDVSSSNWWHSTLHPGCDTSCSCYYLKSEYLQTAGGLESCWKCPKHKRAQVK